MCSLLLRIVRAGWCD
ncbi:hypothetical protein ACR0TQ_004711 [Escherichia coli]